MPKPLVGPVNVLKRLYLTVLVLTSVSDTACFAHSGFVLMDRWKMLSMASDNSKVFLTVRTAITRLTFLSGMPSPASLASQSSVLIDPRAPTVKFACVHVHLSLPSLRLLYTSRKFLWFSYHRFLKESFSSAQSPGSSREPVRVSMGLVNSKNTHILSSA